MFEMNAGFNPFKTGKKMEMADQMNMIIFSDIKMPPFFSKDCADLCRRLLIKNVS